MAVAVAKLLCRAVLLAVLVTSNSSPAQTVVERLIAARNPCRDLRRDTLFGRIGIDRLESVRLSSADLSLRGDSVSIVLHGSLSCRTSDNALYEGHASAAIVASAHGNVSTCEMAVDVDLSGFSGRYGSILAFFEGILETELERLVGDEARSACERFKTPG